MNQTPQAAVSSTVGRLVRRWQVRHDEGPDYGLTPPDFATRGEACFRRDEWNKECPGHYVKMIEVAPNATLQGSPEAQRKEIP